MHKRTQIQAGKMRVGNDGTHMSQPGMYKFKKAC